MHSCWHQFQPLNMERLKVDLKAENIDGDRTEREVEVVGPQG